MPAHARVPADGVRRVGPGSRSASGTVPDQSARTGEHGFGLFWLVGVSLAFMLAILLFTPMRTALAWDETVYASQISQHLPMLWSAERARGMPLLVAPVTLMTGSATVLRVYLTLLAGVGLFAALLCWRRLRPDWVLALASLVFGGLWIVESQASQVFPNFWIAIGALAGVGLFLRIAAGLGKGGSVVLVGVAAAFTSLMRPPDALAVFGLLLLATVVLTLRGRAGRRAQLGKLWGAAIAIVLGLAVGIGEWVVESNRYFGGPLHRLKLQSSAVGGTKFAPFDSLRILSGGRVSSVPGYPSIKGWSDPRLLVWWLAFALIAVLGVYVTWRAKGWLLALTPFACAVCEYLLYTLPARDATRYLQPTWALLAISAADGLAWLLTRPNGWQRPAAILVAAAFMGTELVTQHAVLMTQKASYTAGAQLISNASNALRQAGVTAPCVITSVDRPNFSDLSEPAAYALGCNYKWTMGRVGAAHGSRIIVMVLGSAPPFPYAQSWPSHKLPGGVIAYLEPASG